MRPYEADGHGGSASTVEFAVMDFEEGECPPELGHETRATLCGAWYRWLSGRPPMRNPTRRQGLDPLRCRHCQQHTDLCVCSLLGPWLTPTKVVLVAHRLELRKSTNTGHLAAACLQGARLCVRGDRDGQDTPVTWSPESTPLFLFPCDDAVPLDVWKLRQGATTNGITLIVPDGTWRQAKRVRRRVSGLADVQAVRLPSTLPSGYRLRKAGAAQLATLEAIAYALGILDGPEIQAHLLHVFRAVVDRALWSSGRLAGSEVRGGVPAGARQDACAPAAQGTKPGKLGSMAVTHHQVATHTES